MTFAVVELPRGAFHLVSLEDSNFELLSIACGSESGSFFSQLGGLDLWIYSRIRFGL